MTSTLYRQCGQSRAEEPDVGKLQVRFCEGCHSNRL